MQRSIVPGRSGILARVAVFIAVFAVVPALRAAPEIGFAPLAQWPQEGVVVLPYHPDGSLPANLPDGVRHTIRQAVANAEFQGEKGAALSIYTASPYDLLLLVGLGEGDGDTALLQDTGGTVAQQHYGPTTSVAVMSPAAGDNGAAPATELALGLRLGAYRFAGYRSTPEPDNGKGTVETFTVYTGDPEAARTTWERDGRAVADAVYFARDLISEPPNELYPQVFVQRAQAAFEGLDNVVVNVLDEKQMQKLGLGSLLGVGMGSERPPRLLLVEYRGGGADQAPVAFVGKGVTFDTGGISLKRSEGMWKMKYDMAGAAAATATVLALAKRGASVNAVAVAALVENMPSGRAQRPGDVRRAVNGKTIEVLNTDAEGRLILADAVAYAEREYKPRLLVDLATLTGSVRVALGSVYAGLFTRDDELASRLVASGGKSGEPVWLLPLHRDFRKAIESDIADIKNVSGDRKAGASIGAEVIGSFVSGDTPWVHLDIAGVAWEEEGAPTVPPGAVGFGVRLLNAVVADYYQ